MILSLTFAICLQQRLRIKQGLSKIAVKFSFAGFEATEAGLTDGLATADRAYGTPARTISYVVKKIAFKKIALFYND